MSQTKMRINDTKVSIPCDIVLVNGLEKVLHIAFTSKCNSAFRENFGMQDQVETRSRKTGPL